MHRSRMSKDMRCDPLSRQSRHFSGRCFDILAQPESEAGSGERLPVAIDEYHFIGAPWVSAQ